MKIPLFRKKNEVEGVQGKFKNSQQNIYVILINDNQIL